MRIETHVYANVHGKLPRGTGRWGFSQSRDPDWNRQDDPKERVYWTPRPMTLTQAKR